MSGWLGTTGAADTAILERLVSLKVGWVRCGIRPGDPITAMVQTFAATGMMPCFLTYPDTDLRGILEQSLAQLGQAFMLQIGNEPGGPDFKGTYEEWIAWQGSSHDLARTMGFTGRVLCGGVANLEGQNRQWLTRMGKDLPSDMTLDFHRYPKGNQPNRAAPQDGFDSREDELRWLHDTAAGRDLSCSEFGYHTAPEQYGRWPHTSMLRATDEQVKEWLLADIALFRPQLVLAAQYQQQDGPNPDNAQDRFGVLAYGPGHPSTWAAKPAADVFAITNG